MKISLNLNQGGTVSAKVAQARNMEQDILASRRGDWNARRNLVQQFQPLLLNLAHKRTNDPAKVAELVEAGTDGLLRAVRKYKKNVGAEHFRVFALDYIEAQMTRAAKGGSWWSRLFGR
jgi:DNA-directed RNA polymerase specialized sigma subunit